MHEYRNLDMHVHNVHMAFTHFPFFAFPEIFLSWGWYILYLFLLIYEVAKNG